MKPETIYGLLLLAAFAAVSSLMENRENILWHLRNGLGEALIGLIVNIGLLIIFAAALFWAIGTFI